MVAEDYRFRSITELWLGGDHYKWRAMRTNGVDERYITGDASDWEKFEKWAETVPYTLRNPLYHWTHLELRTAFGIDKLLNPSTAREIYEECNEKLAQPGFSARGLMRRYRVETVCTTDDPVDSLEHHIATKASGFEIRMLPTWRPDKAMAVENPASFRDYVERLEQASGQTISGGRSGMCPFQVGHVGGVCPDGCRKGMDATIPLRDDTQCQQSDDVSLGAGYGFRFHRRVQYRPLHGAFPRPIGQPWHTSSNHPLQPESGSQ